MRVLGEVKAWAISYAGAFTLRDSFYAPREVAFPSTDFDRNSACNWVSIPVPQENHIPYKSAVLSPPVPLCRLLSVKEKGYEQIRSQVQLLPDINKILLCKRKSLNNLKGKAHSNPLEAHP